MGRLTRGDRVEGARLEGGEELTADATVLAAGVWSDQLARAIGLRIPMQPARGYHRDLVGLETMPPRGCVLNETFIAVSPFHDTLRRGVCSRGDNTSHLLVFLVVMLSLPSLLSFPSWSP